VSVRVTTQAKKIASPLVMVTRANAKTKVFPRTPGSLASLNAATQPLIVQMVGCPGLLATKLLTKSSPMG
jgi:hypothetical protein